MQRPGPVHTIYIYICIHDYVYTYIYISIYLYPYINAKRQQFFVHSPTETNTIAAHTCSYPADLWKIFLDFIWQRFTCSVSLLLADSLSFNCTCIRPSSPPRPLMRILKSQLATKLTIWSECRADYLNGWFLTLFHSHAYTYVCIYVYMLVQIFRYMPYGVATISRLLKIIGHFCRI